MGAKVVLSEVAVGSLKLDRASFSWSRAHARRSASSSSSPPVAGKFGQASTAEDLPNVTLAPASSYEESEGEVVEDS